MLAAAALEHGSAILHAGKHPVAQPLADLQEPGLAAFLHHDAGECGPGDDALQRGLLDGAGRRGRSAGERSGCGRLA